MFEEMPSRLPTWEGPQACQVSRNRGDVHVGVTQAGEQPHPARGSLRTHPSALRCAKPLIHFVAMDPDPLSGGAHTHTVQPTS
jgi:hypothetical protein